MAQKGIKIEYYEESGKQGGCEGFVVDFDKKMVYPSHGAVQKFSIENAEDIQWTIEGNLKMLNAEVKRLKEKISLKKVKNVRIEGGYKIISPPSESMIKILQEKLKETIDQIKNLKSIDVLTIIKNKNK